MEPGILSCNLLIHCSKDCRYPILLFREELVKWENSMQSTVRWVGGWTRDEACVPGLDPSSKSEWHFCTGEGPQQSQLAAGCGLVATSLTS